MLEGENEVCALQSNTVGALINRREKLSTLTDNADDPSVAVTVAQISIHVVVITLKHEMASKYHLRCV